MLECIQCFLKEITRRAEFIRVEEFSGPQVVPDFILAHPGGQTFIDIFVRQLYQAATMLPQATSNFFCGFAPYIIVIEA